MSRHPAHPARPPSRQQRLGASVAATSTALLLCAAGPAGAGTFGSLANFDAVNDTGHPAYGFEIEIEDSRYDHPGMITSVFGYDRVFGFISPDPGAVVRFGKPSIHYVAGFGARIVYGGAVGPVFTPSGSFNNPGDSCWPGSQRWTTADACDHFGISTLGSPATTRYSWLVESTPGVLVKQSTGLPPVGFVYTPPVANAPAALQVQIRAVAAPEDQPNDNQRWGEALWVKTFTTKLRNNIDLGNLLRGDRDMEAAEVEREWSIFQKAPVGLGAEGANEVKQAEVGLGKLDKAVMRRYEFYKYSGPFDPDGMGEVLCDNACEQDPTGALLGQHASFVGNFVGAQMAGFNVDAAPVPEPQTWALLLSGLAFFGARLRRR